MDGVTAGQEGEISKETVSFRFRIPRDYGGVCFALFAFTSCQKRFFTTERGCGMRQSIPRILIQQWPMTAYCGQGVPGRQLAELCMRCSQGVG